jgi:hypothetical protein
MTLVQDVEGSSAACTQIAAKDNWRRASSGHASRRRSQGNSVLPSSEITAQAFKIKFKSAADVGWAKRRWAIQEAVRI